MLPLNQFVLIVKVTEGSFHFLEALLAIVLLLDVLDKLLVLEGYRIVKHFVLLSKCMKV